LDTESSRAECQSYFEERLKTDLKHGDPVFVSINVAPAYCYTQDAVHELVLYGADYDDSGMQSHIIVSIQAIAAKILSMEEKR